MKANFDALYDAAMEANARLRSAVQEGQVDLLCGTNFCLLEVGDFINYRIHLLPRGDYDKSFSLKAYEGYPAKRDCTTQEIEDVTAKAIAELNKLTRAGRIAELEAELAELKAEENF